MIGVAVLAALAVIPEPTRVERNGGETPAQTFASLTSRVDCVTDPKIAAEGYELEVSAKGVITIRSSDAAGAFYAQKTLEQIVDWRGYPCVRISDSPRYRWRGVLLDECRHFFGKETVKRTLDLMAQYKLNVLHWHLTDDQGWRLDVPGYPELVKYGAVRSASPRHGATVEWIDREKELYTMATDGQTYGPYFYTEADVKEILAYAAARHIRIVPEIELPGHVYAALVAYPEFACCPENLTKRSPRLIWGIEKDVLCIGNDKAIKFMEDVLDYVCRLFPSDVVHIGGDECPQERWKTCPKCQARIKSEGLKDEHGLQPWITRHFVDFLVKRGKRALGWDEYLLGDVPADAIGMSWRAGGGGAGHRFLTPRECVEAGHDMVMTPRTHCYIDYGQGLGEDPFQYIGGCVTLEKCHSLDLCEGIPENLRQHILGGQGNNWSEYTWNRYDLEWKMWPRTCALAEVFWCGDGKPPFDDFLRRMKVHRRRLISQGVNCAPLN